MAACGAYSPSTGPVLSKIAPKIRASQFVAVLGELAVRDRLAGRLILVVLDDANLYRGGGRGTWGRGDAACPVGAPFRLPACCPGLDECERVWNCE